jgi:3,5-epimerase/4-reductase
MSYLIYGGYGWIGNKICEILEKEPFNKNVIKSKKRLENLDEIKQEINEIKPERVICCIGRTHGIYNGEEIPTIDYLEKPGKLKENIRDNLFGPFMLALECFKRDIHMTYMGTGCIFTYTEIQKCFKENDLPNFFGSGYSTVKGFTDQMMNQMNNVLNVRIRMPISLDKSPRNLLIKLLKYKKICSIPNSMTILDELLPIMCQMLEQKKTGAINLVNPGVIDHDTILQLYKKYVNSEHTYELVSYEDQIKFLASERSNNELDTTELESFKSCENYKIDNIKDGIENIFKKWN